MGGLSLTNGYVRAERLTGVKINPVEGVTVNWRWTQIGPILAKYALGIKQGYARITRTSGSNPFIAYAVVTGGGQPGEQAGDGGVVMSSP